MWKGNPNTLGLTLALALSALTLAACGSGNAPPTVDVPAVSKATADHLAKLSDRIATDLDAGDTCHAAHAADDLSAAVQESDLRGNLRPAVDQVATRLVNEVNCPPPPPPPEKKHKKQDENGDNQGQGNGDQHR